MRRMIGSLIGIVGSVMIGCADEGGGATLDQDLALGASGADVTVVNDYLTRFGYFPNAELAREFPAWRPIVATAPANPSVFDERTEAALRRLQANTGLPVTGIADQATRSLLQMERCGVPDGIEDLGAGDKFFVNGISPSVGAYRVSSVGPDDGPVTLATLVSQTFSAGFSWGSDAEVTFSPGTAAGTNTAPHISVGWGTPPLGSIATTSGSGSANAVITLRRIPATGNTWTTSTNPTITQYNVRAALIHHLGHAMGLNHSAFSSAVMHPNFPLIGTALFTITTDDRAGISAAWDQYAQASGGGLGVDIAVGEDGSIWAIGTDDQDHGKGIYKYNGSGWVADVIVPGAQKRTGGITIAVKSNGIPIITQDNLTILERNSSDPNVPGWSGVGGGLAKDVGVGGGHIWVIGSDNRVWKRDGASWTQDPTLRHGQRISVSPAGRPWVIDGGLAFRRSSSELANGAWTQTPGNSLTDIGVGPGGTSDFGAAAVFVTNQTAGHIYVWSEQPGSGSGEFAIPAIATWRIAGNNRTSGTPSPTGFNARAGIGVTPQGKPWVVGINGAFFRPTK